MTLKLGSLIKIGVFYTMLLLFRNTFIHIEDMNILLKKYDIFSQSLLGSKDTFTIALCFIGHPSSLIYQCPKLKPKIVTQNVLGTCLWSHSIAE